MVVSSRSLCPSHLISHFPLLSLFIKVFEASVIHFYIYVHNQSHISLIYFLYQHAPAAIFPYFHSFGYHLYPSWVVEMLTIFEDIQFITEKYWSKEILLPWWTNNVQTFTNLVTHVCHFRSASTLLKRVRSAALVTALPKYSTTSVYLLPKILSLSVFLI